MSQMERINHLLHEVPENQLYEVLDFLMFLSMKNDKRAIRDIESASLSSTGFWDNNDDEVWDNV
ncbi:MAG: DUF2281 domain-containing protein [Oscillospiraceae bacterium]|nr:DUF2281 domain-containing protein [Oscillospiraceae bacterium]